MRILVASNLYPPYYRGGYDPRIEEMKSVLVAPIAESVCLGTTISSSALDVVPGKVRTGGCRPVSCLEVADVYVSASEREAAAGHRRGHGAWIAVCSDQYWVNNEPGKGQKLGRSPFSRCSKKGARAQTQNQGADGE